MEIDFKTAMVIAAHPDDSEFNCAGTVAQWVDQGVDVTYVVLSRGDKGSGDRLMTPELLAAMRESEQRAAACYLGVKQVAFLDFRDGEIWDSPTARERVVRAIRTYRPEAVLTHDPATYYHGDLFLNHPDHKATGDIALAAIYPLARDHMHFPEHLAEGLETHNVREIWLFGSEQANVYVDIEPTIERKIGALRLHESQFDDMEELARMVRALAGRAGEGAQVPLAEAFRRIKMVF